MAGTSWRRSCGASPPSLTSGPRIVLPTSKAVTAVIALFYAVGYWNSWFNILLFMPADSAKWPL